MTLDEAIEQAINLGEKDPVAAAAKIIKRHDEKWLAAELASLAEDIVAERIRQRLAALRRGSEKALVPTAGLSQNEMLLRVFPVPTEDGVWEYKPFGQATAQDLLRRAAWYDGMARAALKHSLWYRTIERMMRAESALTVSALKAPLPEFPGPDDELALPEAA